MADRKQANSSRQKAEKISIDEGNGLVFDSEEELYKHFASEIQSLEEMFFQWRRPTEDIAEGQFERYEKNLSVLLEDPDEIWRNSSLIKDHSLNVYIKAFLDVEKIAAQSASDDAQTEHDEDTPLLFHVAVVYLTNKVPSFVYLHFPTRDIDLVERFRSGELVFDRSFKDAPAGALEGDALLEGDELALGLYEAMLTLRSENDVTEAEFRDYSDLRESTIEEPDEIWRTNDSMGNILVNFIKDYSDQYNGDLFYVVVTLEDTPSNSHSLLFSFPTSDKNLLGRYRHGDNLQAEEVIQEASH